MPPSRSEDLASWSWSILSPGAHRKGRWGVGGGSGFIHTILHRCRGLLPVQHPSYGLHQAICSLFAVRRDKARMESGSPCDPALPEPQRGSHHRQRKILRFREKQRQNLTLPVSGSVCTELSPSHLAQKRKARGSIHRALTRRTNLPEYFSSTH